MSKVNRHRQRLPGWVQVLASAVFLGTLFFTWWFFTHFLNVESWIFPTPEAFMQRFIVEVQRTQLWEAVAVTLLEAILGSLLGAAVALPLAYCIYRFRFISAAIEPFLGVTQAIPAIALAPLLVLWFGYGLAPIVFLCAMLVFFPILIATTIGLRRLDQEIIEAAVLDGAAGLVLLKNVEIPLALPAILGGVRNGFTLSITGAVVGELVMGGNGLGSILTAQRNAVDTVGMFVTIALLCTLAMIFYGVIYFFERRSKLVNLD
ncbi:ABC transporter permease [Gleimia sp. 6138-11-ORH1]|uniref:ABC transporter permease n=1 Tax=Gleimia sp. 6138-11-ORH1 TaxID=2973937 RepID=UPI002168A08F|nr:ABC transporter permease [Gleimia sp. 6138-11-ORH1]MCS4484357.1 ABC transporter permease [Gleimia sp. 6138-11-ORH1]